MSSDGVSIRHPWAERLLGEVASVTVGGTPSTAIEKYWGGNVPWMASGDVHLHRIAEVPGRISDLGLKASNATLVTPPAAAIGLAGQGKTRGTVALVETTLCTNQSVALITDHSGAIDIPYLFHNLSYRYDELRSRSAGGGRAGLSKGIIEQLPIALPSIDEQRGISRILDAIDKAIEQTKTIIAKQQRIKTGLMQDLLTRGIDEHGNIRSEATHTFKDSPLGRIPVDWELKSLSDAFAMPPRNGIYKPAQQIGEGSLLIGQNAFTKDGTLDYALARRAFVNAAELDTFGLIEGDLLVSRVFATAEGVGKPVTVSNLPEPAVYESNMLRLRFNADCVHPGFVFHWLLSHRMRSEITSSVNASNQASINQKTLNMLAIVIPTKSEQERILSVIATASESLLVLQRSLGKLRRNKSALMQDLLTGKVRVTPLLEAGA